jgi:hypothetical protein
MNKSRMTVPASPAPRRPRAPRGREKPCSANALATTSAGGGRAPRYWQRTIGTVADGPVLASRTTRTHLSPTVAKVA